MCVLDKEEDVLDKEGGMVVASRAHVLNQLQWLSDQFPWTTFTTL